MNSKKEKKSKSMKTDKIKIKDTTIGIMAEEEIDPGRDRENRDRWEGGELVSRSTTVHLRWRIPTRQDIPSSCNADQHG